ncbi:MAG: hypothetical protein ACK4K9_00785 [Bacteroidia bacterium]
MSEQRFKINTDNVSEFISYCLENRLAKTDVRSIIQSNGLNEDMAEQVFRKYCCEVNSKLGWKIIGIGGVVLLLAFFAPFVMDYNNPMFKISLYGFTSVGGALSMFGLYKIIG